MGKVIAGFTMSLDGFIAEPNDDVGRLFTWYTSGDVPFPVAGTEMVFRVSRASADVLHERFEMTGSIVTGRRDFDVSHAWGGSPPLGVPIFIVTHTPPTAWVGKDSPFTFVTDGVPRAIEQARAAAGAKNVAVGSTTTMHQGLLAGLIDEIEVDLVPILLGDGIRLFGPGGTEPIRLETVRVIEAPGVTHLRFRVVR